MRIRYTLHALEGMRQRGIPRRLVEGCIARPDRVIEGGEERCVKPVEPGGTVAVITAFYSTRVGRCL